jgi:hypothetical protein
LVSTNTKTGTEANSFTGAGRVDIKDSEDGSGRYTDDNNVFYVELVSRDVVGGNGNSETFNDVLNGFYSSPPKRWGGRDLRCYPYIPKKLSPWYNSSYNYYYRPRCLVGRM